MQSSATVYPYVAGHAMNQKLDQLLLLVQMSKTTKMMEEIAMLNAKEGRHDHQEEARGKSEVSFSKKTSLIFHI